MFNRLLLDSSQYRDTEKTLALIKDNIPEYLFHYAHCIDFVMFSPDAIIQNAHKAIIEEQHFFVLQHKFLSLNEQQAEAVYEKELVLDKIKSWWIKRRIFTLGPTMVSIIGKKPEGDDRFLWDYVLKLKGNSDPLLFKEGTIRSRYRVSSKSFGFMHSSDDLYSIFKEALVFFSLSEIKEALIQIKECVEREVSPTQHNKKKSLSINMADHNVELNYYKVIFNLKQLLLNKLIYEYGIQIKDKTLRSILAIHEKAREITDLRFNFREERQKISELLRKEYDLLNRCLRRYQTESFHVKDFMTYKDLRKSLNIREIIALLRVLSEEQQFNQTDVFLLVKRIENQNIYLNEWEKLLLQSAFFFYRTV